jgi:hypothetical protein
MGRLFDTIRQLVIAERYVIGQHASERLEERGILEWQVVSGLDEGELIVERPDAKSNPDIEVRPWRTERRSRPSGRISARPESRSS